MEQEAQDRLAPELEKLSKLLVAIEEAMRAFGQTGWFNKKIQRAKAAKKFRNIDTKIERVIQTINRVVQTINRVLDTVSRGLALDIQQRIYPAEEAGWSKIDERIAESGGEPMDEDDVREAADGILADPKELATVAKAGGLSEDVFREEMGEMRADLEKMGKSIESMVQGFGEALSGKLRGVL
jgi:methyl-accepting chemotaxis protein